MKHGYIFFKLFNFSVRRGYLNPEWICYCWKEKRLLESNRYCVIFGDMHLFVGLVRLHSTDRRRSLMIVRHTMQPLILGSLWHTKAGKVIDGD